MVGLLMGAFFHNTMQVNSWSTLVMLALMMPSWLTIMALPAPLETVLHLVPTHYMGRMLGLALAGEASLTRIGGDLAVLAGSTVAVVAAVVWTLRRLERSGA